MSYFEPIHLTCTRTIRDWKRSTVKVTSVKQSELRFTNFCLQTYQPSPFIWFTKNCERKRRILVLDHNEKKLNKEIKIPGKTLPAADAISACIINFIASSKVRIMNELTPSSRHKIRLFRSRWFLGSFLS